MRITTFIIYTCTCTMYVYIHTCITVLCHMCYCIHTGGDQLTVARGRSSKRQFYSWERPSRGIGTCCRGLACKGVLVGGKNLSTLLYSIPSTCTCSVLIICMMYVKDKCISTGYLEASLQVLLRHGLWDPLPAAEAD